MGFWELAYKMKWIGKDILKLAVITELNPFGEVTKEEYKKITGEEFAVEQPSE